MNQSLIAHWRANIFVRLHIMQSGKNASSLKRKSSHLQKCFPLAQLELGLSQSAPIPSFSASPRHRRGHRTSPGIDADRSIDRNGATIVADGSPGQPLAAPCEQPAAAHWLRRTKDVEEVCGGMTGTTPPPPQGWWASGASRRQPCRRSPRSQPPGSNRRRRPYRPTPTPPAESGNGPVGGRSIHLGPVSPSGCTHVSQRERRRRPTPPGRHAC